MTFNVRATPTVWVAVNWIRDVATAAHTKMGMRKGVMPLARMNETVTSKLMELAMEESPFR